MDAEGARKTVRVLSSNIDVVTWDVALDRLCDWAAQGQSRYACMCNVHVVVSAHGDPDLLAVVNSADMAAPDGMPVSIWLRTNGYPSQRRIAGPDLMWKHLERAAQEDQPVYFYGSTDETLRKLIENCRAAFPALRIAGSYSPPFRALTPSEEKEAVRRINESGARIVYVGLGCPKQELWMARQRGHIHAVMIGVGAAFDFHAGTLRRAPRWMQEIGLEWLHRLLSEPGRLWKRYLVCNAVFLSHLVVHLLSSRRERS